MSNKQIFKEFIQELSSKWNELRSDNEEFKNFLAMQSEKLELATA